MSLKDDIKKAVHGSLHDKHDRPRPMAKGVLAQEVAESFVGRQDAPSLDDVLTLIIEMEQNGEVIFVENTVLPPV